MNRRWTNAENDYRGVLDRSVVRSCSVAVIIPAFERVGTLQRTLAGLVSQDSAALREVIVVDDESPVSLRDIVDSFSDELPVTYLHQQFDGFGAGRARNLGAAAATSDVLLFIDADCVPAPDLVERHVRWHDRATNLVIVGSRVVVDAERWLPDDVATGKLARQELEDARNEWDEVPVLDWRAKFYRGNRRLIIDDAAYRACVSNNLSVSRAAFEEVAGFSDVFQSWGGEDTELGWRLFQDGNFVVPDDSAVVFHQVQGGDRDVSDVARSRQQTSNRSLVADLIPNRAYRRVAASTYTVPRLTWLVSGRNATQIGSNLKWINAAGVLDNDIVVFGPRSSVAQWTSLGRSSDRFSLVEGEGEAMLADILPRVRGEFVACVGDVVSADVSAIHKVLRRFESDPRLGIVRVPYVDADGDVARRYGDLAAFDEAQGFPVFCVVRRRALAKSDRDATILIAVVSASESERKSLIGSPKAMVGASLAHISKPPDIATLRRLGAKDVARSVRRRVAPARREPQTEPQNPQATDITYIGFTGRSNLGDEAILRAVREMLPDADVRREHPSPRALMVGGGTIINAAGYYLTRVLREDRPGIMHLMFAPGVRDPAFWGKTESMEDWWSFLRSVEKPTVRGPDSARHLRTLGWKGEVEVIGDPALSLLRPETPSRLDEVIIAPLNTRGNLYGGEDQVVLDALVKEVRQLAGEGFLVTLMSSFPEDDRWIIDIQRRAEVPSLGYIAGYEDLDATLARIAAAKLVIGERLHASILAAAMDTVFVPIAYRPKVIDFARSVDAEDLVVRTDAMHLLRDRVSFALENDSDLTSRVGRRVERFRSLQTQHAQEIAAALVLG